MFWLSIDVGGAVLGWALWYDTVLIACGLSRTKAKDCRQRAHAHRANIHAAAPFDDGHWPKRVVVEMGTWRGRAKRKMTPQQLADFNLIAGFLGTHWYTPREWKGGASRATEQGRTRAALRPDELALLDAVKPTNLAHNACSAVGVGLAFLKRAHVPSGATCDLPEQPTTSSKPTPRRAARRATSASTTSAWKKNSTGVSSRTGSSRPSAKSSTPKPRQRPPFRMSEAALG